MSNKPRRSQPHAPNRIQERSLRNIGKRRHRTVAKSSSPGEQVHPVMQATRIAASRLSPGTVVLGRVRFVEGNDYKIRPAIVLSVSGDKLEVRACTSSPRALRRAGMTLITDLAAPGLIRTTAVRPGTETMALEDVVSVSGQLSERDFAEVCGSGTRAASTVVVASPGTSESSQSPKPEAVVLSIGRGKRRLPDPRLAPPQKRPTALASNGNCSGTNGRYTDIDDVRQDPQAGEAARKLCQQCPVAAVCLDYAMANEPYGFWGGLDAYEREARRGGPIPSIEDRHEAEQIRGLFRRGLSASRIAAMFGVTQRTVERWKDEAGLVEHRTAEAPSAADPDGEAA